MKTYSLSEKPRTCRYQHIRSRKRHKNACYICTGYHFLTQSCLLVQFVFQFFRLFLARTFGDPHLVSLDGTQYTFNGHGEFILVQSIDESLMVQARMTEPFSNDTNQTSGTVITAIVAKHNDSDTVQFEIADNNLKILVNGDMIDFKGLSEQQFKHLTVSQKGNQSYTVAIYPGITISLRGNEVMLYDISITLSNLYLHNTVGLLGYYNGKPEDDLLSKSNNTIPSNASNEVIHDQFGLTCKLHIL